MTWKQCLIADCENYGTFCGRWHSNEYWDELRSRADGMTEDEARAAVEEYEQEARDALARWGQTT